MATQPFAPPGASAAAHRTLARLLEPADVVLGGSRPWDIVVHDPRMPARVLAQGSLGAGEAYMDGWWDCERLDDMLARLLRSGLDRRLRTADAIRMSLLALLRNPQGLRRAFIVGRSHYDVGDDLFERMLDPRMIYSCAWWEGASDLASAQEAKLDLVCRKLGLERGMRVLDIGCGWGAFVKYAAEKYRVEAVGTTVSKEQAALAKELCAGLPVEIRFADYRDLSERFDRIVSVGMIEHVGYRNYGVYMKIVHDCLADDGLFLLQTIGTLRSTTSTDPWIKKYVFPNSMLPSIRQLAKATEGLFVTEDLHNFGPDYDKTLMAWWRNFDDHWPELQGEYGERFYRMWKYYLLCCAGSFRARWNQLWQIVYSKRGVPGGYAAIR